MEFEHYIASVYKSLGFHVRENVLINGQQIDVLAEFYIPGSSSVKIAIECKYKSKGNVDNQDVFDFISVVRSLIGSEIQTAVVVTNSDFTLQSKEAAKNVSGLSLRTLRELESEVLDISRGCVEYIQLYENKEISGQYVPLSGNSRQLRVENVEDFVIKKLGSSGSSLIFLLGDYGAGKSTVLERIKYKLSKSFLQRANESRPLLLVLRELHKYATLDDFIVASLAQQYARDVPVSAFWNFVRAGRLTLLLDGFDEISQSTNRDIRLSHLVTLAPLLYSSSPCVLTCRPSYFVSEDELSEALSLIHRAHVPMMPVKLRMGSSNNDLHSFLFDKLLGPDKGLAKHEDVTHVRLLGFSSEQVDKYLEHFGERFSTELNCSLKDVREFIDRVYDLADLIQRPILLKLIVETLLSGKLDISDLERKVSAAWLYEAYTSLSLEAEWDKGETRRLLSSGDRLEFAIAMALTMYDRNTLDVSYHEIVDTLSRAFAKNSGIMKRIAKLPLEAVAADVQVCAFLSRYTEDRFRFIHKSFFEYFVALHLTDRFRRGIVDPRLHSAVPDTILYFFGACVQMHQELHAGLKNALKAADRYLDEPGRSPDLKKVAAFKSNITKSVFYAGDLTGPLEIQFLELVDFKLRNIKLVDLSLPRSSFRSSSLENVAFVDTSMILSAFESVTLASCKIENCSIDGSMDSTYIENTHFHKSSANISFHRSTLERSVLAECQLEFVNEVRLQRCDFVNCKALVRIPAANAFLHNCSFEQCEVAIGSAGGDRLPRLKECVFIDCAIAILVCSVEDFLSCKFERGNVMALMPILDVRITQTSDRGKKSGYLASHVNSCLCFDLTLLPINAEYAKSCRAKVVKTFGQKAGKVFDRTLNELLASPAR